MENYFVHTDSVGYSIIWLGIIGRLMQSMPIIYEPKCMHTRSYTTHTCVAELLTQKCMHSLFELLLPSIESVGSSQSLQAVGSIISTEILVST